MRRCGVVFVFTMLVCGAGAAASRQGGGAASSPDLRGVWKVVSYVRDGQTVPMDAMMIITGRHFSRVESERNRNPLEGIDFRRVDALSPAQIRLVAEAFARTNGSSGTYRVEGGTFYFTSVTHHNPAALGHEAQRKINLQGDRLKLSGPAGSGVLEETWERIEKF